MNPTQPLTPGTLVEFRGGTSATPTELANAAGWKLKKGEVYTVRDVVHLPTHDEIHLKESQGIFNAAMFYVFWSPTSESDPIDLFFERELSRNDFPEIPEDSAPYYPEE